MPSGPCHRPTITCAPADFLSAAGEAAGLLKGDVAGLVAGDVAGGAFGVSTFGSQAMPKTTAAAAKTVSRADLLKFEFFIFVSLPEPSSGWMASVVSRSFQGGHDHESAPAVFENGRVPQSPKNDSILQNKASAARLHTLDRAKERAAHENLQEKSVRTGSGNDRVLHPATLGSKERCPRFSRRGDSVFALADDLALI